MRKLILAEQSSDLSDSPDGVLVDVDILRAAGAACQRHHAAVDIWRALVQADKRALKWVIQVLHTQAVRLGSKNPAADVHAVIEGYLQPHCGVCGGRGIVPDVVDKKLVEKTCPACQGSGERPKLFTGPQGKLRAYVGDQLDLATSLIQSKLRQ